MLYVKNQIYLFNIWLEFVSYLLIGLIRLDYADYFQNPHLDPSPYYYQGGVVGVLMIHGYTATPVETRLVGKYLASLGYSVFAPLLPGHGTKIEDLHIASYREWIQFVEEAYLDLSEKCKLVFVGGISMGALLALYLGARFAEIAGLITYAPALKLRNRFAPYARYLRYFTKTFSWRKNKKIPSVTDERWCGYNIDSLPAITQVLELQHLVRDSISDLDHPILIIQGMLDQTVDPEGAQELFDLVKSRDKQLIWLDKSGHCLTLDMEWEIAAERTGAFIQRLSS